MTTKAQRKQDVAKIATKIVAGMSQEIEAQEDHEDSEAARNAKTNTKGTMLMCELTLAKRAGMPDPQVITVNREIKWVKRGAKVVVPWYFIEHLLHNVERKFRQEPDPTDSRKRIVAHDDTETESFNYRMIDPAEGMEIEGPNPPQPLFT